MQQLDRSDRPRLSSLVRCSKKKWLPLPAPGQPARLGRDGPACGLPERSRRAYPMDPRRSWLRKPTGRRSPAALTVPADLASEASSLKKRLGKVNTSPEDGFWRLDFAGAPHGDLCHAHRKTPLESASAPALARPPFSATRPTDDSQEHINIGRRRIASGWWYRPARHAWASRNGRSESPGLLTVI